MVKSNKSNKTFSSRLTRWVDRLLPFEFSIVHTPGRTLGMADYLSRHPSEYEGSVAKAEELFNDWFTVNVVREITPEMKRLADWRKPIKSQESKKVQHTQANKVLSIQAPMQIDSKIEREKAVDKQLIEMAEAKDLTNSKISSVYVKAIAENDRIFQKIINLVLNKNTAVIARLPPPWREKFISFSVDSNGLLYMDHRLIIPKDMRENMLRAIHFGHAGRDAMLREASDVWWPGIHREIINKARNCSECREAGKNFKCIKSQKEFGKLPQANQPNEEVFLDFAGSFQNANLKKKYILVSVDNHSGWPDALFLPNPTADKVIEFLVEYISKNGIPNRVRTDPGTAFKSEKFKTFCKEKLIEHVICPVRDHRGNGKVERMIRTINERLRTNKKILISKDKNGISNILFALRSEKGPDGKSAFEKQNGRKPNTEKSRMIEKCILEQDPQIEIEPEDFSEEADSTILVRERVRGTKLEGAFKKVKRKILGESSHTITVLPKTGHQVIYSKRDVAAGSKLASPSKKANANKMAKRKKEAKSNKVAKKLKTAIGQEMGISHQKQVEENKSPHHEEEEKTTIPPVKEQQDNEESLTHKDQEDQTANSEDEKKVPKSQLLNLRQSKAQ